MVSGMHAGVLVGLRPFWWTTPTLCCWSRGFWVTGYLGPVSACLGILQVVALGVGYPYGQRETVLIEAFSV